MVVEKKAGPTPLQIEVLEWIKAGQPAGSFGGSEDLTYRAHARWLEKFGLVSISGSGDTWRVQLTAKGRKWPEVPAYARPAVKGRGGGRKSSSAATPRSSDRQSTSSRSAAEPASESTVDVRYHVQVTRVQIADRWVEASTETEAIHRVLSEFSKSNGHHRKWRTTSTEAEVLEIEQLEQKKRAKAEGDESLLLSLDGAARTLGVPREVIDELVRAGAIEWIQVASSEFISREAIDKFVKDNVRRGREEASKDGVSEPKPEAPVPTAEPNPPITPLSNTSHSTPTKQDGGSGARAGSTERKRPPHPGQVLMTEFIGSRQKLHEIVEETGGNGKELHRISRGEKPMSPAVAASLGMFFGNGQKFWMNLQRRYDDWQE